MNRALVLCGTLFVAAVWAPAAQRSAKSPPAPRPATKGSLSKAGAAKTPQRLVNPANPATRLFQATPEERERALEQMTPQQQQNARQLWQWFDRLPQEQQDLQLHRLERFAQLTPAQRAEVRALLQEVNELAPDRRQQVGQALLRLQTMPATQRAELLDNPAFKERFTPDEQRIVARLADAWLPPL